MSISVSFLKHLILNFEVSAARLFEVHGAKSKLSRRAQPLAF